MLGGREENEIRASIDIFGRLTHDVFLQAKGVSSDRERAARVCPAFTVLLLECELGKGCAIHGTEATPEGW